MSFASDCKKELCVLTIDKPCCMLSELSGQYMTCGSLNLLGRGKVSVQFTCENMAVARRIYTLLSRSLKTPPQIHYVDSTHFGGRRKCILTLGPAESPAFLKAMNMMVTRDGQDSLRAMSPNLSLSRACCMRSFLRGAMLGGGTITNPEIAYHMELPYHDENMRLNLAKCLLKQGLPVKQSSRKGKGYLYYMTTSAWKNLVYFPVQVLLLVWLLQSLLPIMHRLRWAPCQIEGERIPWR